MNRPTLLVLSLVVTLGMVIVVGQVRDVPAPRTDITASYEVDGDSIVLLEGTSEPWHTETWDRWVELVPSSARWRVGRFDALAGPFEGQVEPLSDSLQVWSLRIADLDDDLRDVALVHELGHLITLGPTETVPATDPAVADQCVTYLSMEGCAIPGQIFEQFVSSFWDLEAGWESGEAAATARHSAAPLSYVSRYAATNPGEDVAETFVYFVYSLRPTGDTIADQKMLLMWEFPELVELRSWLRRGLTG